jgi:hypothetical protein
MPPFADGTHADTFEEQIKLMRDRGWTVDDHGRVISAPVDTEALLLIGTTRATMKPFDTFPIRIHTLVSMIDELLAYRAKVQFTPPNLPPTLIRGAAE